MISKLEIQNLQSHKETSLEFHPGINVITGPTDVGKSTVIRSLQDVIQNLFSGGKLRRHKTKKTIINLDGIQKVRTASKNYYNYKGKEYKALRTTVPPEIEAALRMSEVNFQEQHATYFLIADSPGQVAKSLNKVADLQIIDDALKAMRHRVKEEKSNKKFLEERLEKKQGKVKDIQWALEADKAYQKIEKLQAKIAATDLSPLRIKIEEAERQLNLFDSFPYTGKDIQAAGEMVARLTVDSALDQAVFKAEENTWSPPDPAQDIKEILRLIKVLDKSSSTQIAGQIDRAAGCQKRIDSYPQDLDDPTGVIAQLTRASAQVTSVESAISEVLIAEDCSEHAESEVNEARSNLEEKKAAMGICPLCENKL